MGASTWKRTTAGLRIARRSICVARLVARVAQPACNPPGRRVPLHRALTTLNTRDGEHVGDPRARGSRVDDVVGRVSQHRRGVTGERSQLARREPCAGSDSGDGDVVEHAAGGQAALGARRIRVHVHLMAARAEVARELDVESRQAPSDIERAIDQGNRTSAHAQRRSHRVSATVCVRSSQAAPG